MGMSSKVEREFCKQNEKVQHWHVEPFNKFSIHIMLYR